MQSYTAKNGEIALAKSFVRTPQTDLTMDGVVSRRSSLNLRLQADDLHEIEALADLFRTPNARAAFAAAGTGWKQLRFKERLRDRRQCRILRGSLSLRIFMSMARSGRFFERMWMRARRLPVCNMPTWSLHRAEASRSTRVVGLADWSFSKTSPVQIDLDAKQLVFLSLLNFRDKIFLSPER